MNMGVMAKPLIPCMQNHQGRGLDTTLTGYRFIDGLPSGVEEKCVQMATIAQHQAGQSIGQREYALEVGHIWMQQLFCLLDPVGAASARALWTVSITAAVVNIVSMLTSVTLVDAAQHVWCSAEVDLQQCILDLHAGTITVASKESVAELPEHLGDSQFR